MNPFWPFFDLIWCQKYNFSKSVKSIWPPPWETRLNIWSNWYSQVESLAVIKKTLWVGGARYVLEVALFPSTFWIFCLIFNSAWLTEKDPSRIQKRHNGDIWMWLLNPDGNTVCMRFKLPRYRFIGCGPNKINFGTQKVFEQWWGDVIVWSLGRPSTNWNGEYMDKLFVSANFPKWIHQFLSHKSTKTISAFNTYIESRKMRVETMNWSKSQNFTIFNHQN